MIVNVTTKRTNYIRAFGVASLVGLALMSLVCYNNLHNSTFHEERPKLKFEFVSNIRSAEPNEDDFTKRMRRRMEERAANISENCKQLGLHHNRKRIREGLIYSDEYKTVFCQIPKTGITHWKYLFADLMEIDLDKKRNFSYNYKQSYQIDGKEKTKRLFDPDYLKMTVVREPFERLVSAYKSKLKRSRGPVMSRHSEEIRILLTKANITSIPESDWEAPTFSDFINYLVLGNPESVLEDDQHWMKYTELCQPCDFHYDLIGHQETVDEDSKYLLQLIGAPPNLTLPPAYKHHTDDDAVFQHYATVRPRERVFQLYNLLLDDYIVFGYPPPPVLEQLSKRK